MSASSTLLQSSTSWGDSLMVMLTLPPGSTSPASGLTLYRPLPSNWPEGVRTDHLHCCNQEPLPNLEVAAGRATKRDTLLHLESYRSVCCNIGTWYQRRDRQATAWRRRRT
jgi:hypothetical protein